jgi:prepilin-type N-terminal cleavage/methylation domain-containing protein
MNPSQSFDFGAPQKAAGASLCPQEAPRASLSPQEAPGASPVALPRSAPPLRAPAPHKAPGASPVALTNSAPILRAPAPHKAPGASPVASFHNQPRGFTLVELLVVIGIIGLLTAISVPIVMQSLAKARNAAIKAEIDMLHMAIMNYKNEYGSFPPVFDETPLPPSTATVTGIVNRHIRKLFPRISTASPNNLASADQRVALFDTSTTTNPMRITNGLVPWLLGYTSNPADPLGNSTSASRAKLFNFDESRLQRTAVGSATRYSYAPARKQDSPYIYIPHTQYQFLPYSGGTGGAYGSMKVVQQGDPAATLFAHPDPTRPFFNEGTFQILCAGQDETWGTDDDLSNFWPGTRREFLDSLQ